MSIFFSNSHRLRNLATETRYIIRKWKKRFVPITGDTIPTQYSDNKKHRADSQPCAIVIISCFNNGFNISKYQYTNISIYPNTKYQYIQIPNINISKPELFNYCSDFSTNSFFSFWKVCNYSLTSLAG